jgi:hypothetical protein
MQACTAGYALTNIATPKSSLAAGSHYTASARTTLKTPLLTVPLLLREYLLSRRHVYWPLLRNRCHLWVRHSGLHPSYHNIFPFFQINFDILANKAKTLCGTNGKWNFK